MPVPHSLSFTEKSWGDKARKLTEWIKGLSDSCWAAITGECSTHLPDDVLSLGPKLPSWPFVTYPGAKKVDCFSVLCDSDSFWEGSLVLVYFLSCSKISSVVF